MEQSIEQFRNELISKNPDVSDTKEVSIPQAIDEAYKSLDILTDLLLVAMNDTSCIGCAKELASSFGEMRIAFNAVAELKSAYEIDAECHE
jgi:hypothetical protein